MVGKRRPSGPWYGDERRRRLFERGVRSEYPTIRRVKRGSPSLTYAGTIPIAGFSPRSIRIVFPPGRSAVARVYADGPADSPHRYPDDGSLCMWHPRDEKGLRWVERDGLVHLVVLAQWHLFREAHWRISGEWLGEEAPHFDQKLLEQVRAKA